MERRALLATAASALGVALAGCSGDDSDDDGRSSDDALESYRERLETQLDITIRSLSVDDGTVRLDYESTHESDSSEWGYEVGFVSGRFGREVSDGWDADSLRGRVTGADERTFTWRVAATTARDFVEGDLTASEFVDLIFESMSEQ